VKTFFALVDLTPLSCLHMPGHVITVQIWQSFAVIGLNVSLKKDQSSTPVNHDTLACRLSSPPGETQDFIDSVR